ncbi:uncharacterized protein LOC117316199 [Pecten maximus]|uniref:uncharacterized protein LOC117316199 n=1 Tax=Pecten maximus TaxID=6579 RepID=UPI001458272B|nr:uncharacterized protein LOC117316199 [Pecten maximus]
MASKKMSGMHTVKSGKKTKTSYLSKLAKKKTSEKCVEEEQDNCSHENDVSQSKVCTETEDNEQDMSRSVGIATRHQTKGSNETHVEGNSSESEQNRNRNGGSIGPVCHETIESNENDIEEKYNDSEQNRMKRSGIAATEHDTNEIQDGDTGYRFKDTEHILVGNNGGIAASGPEIKVSKDRVVEEKSKDTGGNLSRNGESISLERESKGPKNTEENRKGNNRGIALGHETKVSKDRVVEVKSKNTVGVIMKKSVKISPERVTKGLKNNRGVDLGRETEGSQESSVATGFKEIEANHTETNEMTALGYKTKKSKDRNFEEKSKDTGLNLIRKIGKICLKQKPKGPTVTEENWKGNHRGVALGRETEGSKEYSDDENPSDIMEKMAGSSGLVVPEYGPKESHDDIKTKNPLWNLCVDATQDGISDLDVDVIVSSEDAGLQGFGMVAKQLLQKGGEQYKLQKMVASSMVGDLKSWHFIFTPGAGRLNCKNVAHANIPKLEVTDQDKWCDHFKTFLGRLVKRTNCMGFTSMAIPLLGTGRKGAPTDFVIDLLCGQIRNCAKKPADKAWLQTIYIVHPNRSIVRSIETVAKRLHLYRTPEVTQKPEVTIGKTKTRDYDKYFIEKYSVKLPKKTNDLTDEDCPICMEKIDSKERVELKKCHHVFCLSCAKQSFNVKPACPLCNVVYGTIRGNQPEGFMVEMFGKESLPGFVGCGNIHIYYSFCDGIQDAEHPNPGKPYRGTRREAFLPDDEEGQRVHRLLRKSFQQQMTFTIGSSRTTGRENVVTWNDIHHKTRIHGGSERYGYPDPLYLKRVQEELASKGISEATDS